MKKSFCLKILFVVALLSLAMLCLGACGSSAPADPYACNDGGDHVYGELHYYNNNVYEGESFYVTCTRCGNSKEVAPLEIEHDLVLGNTVDKGNCQNARKDLYDCTICGYSTVKVGELGNHSWSGSCTAMCGSDGYFERSCSVCGTSESGTMIGLQHDIAHRDGELPDCDSEGWKSYDECMRCDYDTYVSIPATDHPNASWVVTLAPTETTKGIREFHCTDCGVEERIEMPETVYTDGLIYDTYDYTTGELMVVGIDRRVSPDATVISVPKTYNGKAITYIADYAFENDTLITEINLEQSQISAIGLASFKGASALTAVKLGQGTTVINEYAFEGCEKLENVSFMNVETICLHAFKGTGIKNLVLPGTLQTIESEAFVDCLSLKTVAIANSTSYIGGGAFSGCEALETLTVPFIGQSAESNNAADTLGFFFGATDYTENAACVPNSLKHLTITNETNVKYRSFYECGSLVTITLPDTLIWTYLDTGYDLTGCTSLSLKEYGNGLYMSSESEPYYMLVKPLNAEITTLTTHANTKVINKNAFYGHASLNTLEVAGAVMMIGSEAFRGCTSLQTVTITSSLKYICHSAFLDCTALNSLTLPSTLLEIEGSAFRNCTSLTRVILPASVSYIGTNAFLDCGLTYAKFEKTTGWYHSDKGFIKYGVLYDNMSDPSIVAVYLSKTMADGWWERSDTHG